jgi:hypothetical protein
LCVADILGTVAGFELSYCFTQGANDPGAESFKSEFLTLINPETFECYIGSFTFIAPEGFLGSPDRVHFITYEVLLYGPFASKIREQYKLCNTIPTTNLSVARLTPVFGRQPSVRRGDSSLKEREWNAKFGDGQLTFAHCASGSKPFHSLLPAVFRLVLLCTIAAYLGCATLSADVTIIVAAEALLYPAGTIIELALVYMAIPYHPGVDDGVGRFWVCKFNYY